MKDFNYHSAKDSKEASKLASSSSAFLAGGMTTIPSMKLGLATYKDLIDIKKIKQLSGIKVSGSTVKIGATTKHVEVANSKDVKKAIPSLAHLAEGIGDPQVRNRGTIGGSIANNDPSADYPSACIALNATIHTNERQIPEKSSYQKYPNPASRYAIVGVYVAKHKTGVNVAVTGAKSCVYNDENISKALEGSFSSNSISNIELDSSEMNSDIHASAEFRSSLVITQAKKAVDAC